MSSAPRMVNLRLIGVAFGDPPDYVFSVKIPLDANVSTLKELIKEACKPTYDAFPASKFRVFDVNLSGEWDQLDAGSFKYAVESAIEGKQPLEAGRKMHDIFSSESLQDRPVSVIVQSPVSSEAQQPVIESLKREHEALFERLQVRVLGFGSWSKRDILNNGGRIFHHDSSERRPAEIVRIETRLAQLRTYAPPGDAWCPGFNTTRNSKYAQLFQGIYAEGDGPTFSVKNDREFVALFRILECYQNDSDRICSDGSSAMKASHLKVYFMVPPFFSCGFEGFEYKEVSLDFPIFLAYMDQPNVRCRYTPTPGVTVVSTSSNFPLIILEVASEEDKSGRERMLLQAIAFARAGQHLIKAKEEFFVVAIYLRANMIAERYVVQTEDGGEQVFLCQKDFNLCDPSGSVSFLREMYNLAAVLEQLAGKFDPGKMASLQHIHELAEQLVSLSEIEKNRKADKYMPRVLGSLVKAPASDGLGVFGADDIQAILREMNYEIKFIPLHYPTVAMVSDVNDCSEAVFFKFVPDGHEEIPILKYLSGIKSPRNYTVTCTRFWSVHGGQLVSMPSAGGWLTRLRDPDAHLWSVARQLLEAVDFMHEHHVAHLNLKPANILIPPGGGRLSIIDFDTSVRVEFSTMTIFCGMAGTPGYIPPEITTDCGFFNAVRADLWTCGKTLSELCYLCRPSAERDALLQISRALMDEDPEKRLMMPDALKRMADYKEALERTD